MQNPNRHIRLFLLVLLVSAVFVTLLFPVSLPRQVSPTTHMVHLGERESRETIRHAGMREMEKVYHYFIRQAETTRQRLPSVQKNREKGTGSNRALHTMFNLCDVRLNKAR